MIRANITKDGLVSPADKFTESILAQKRTALLRAQTKLPDAISFTDILPDFLAKRALKDEYNDIRVHGLTRKAGETIYTWTDHANISIDHVQQVMDTLAQTEHLRWNASHQALGYKCVPKTKDEARLLHDCLCDWEKLDDEKRSYDYNTVDVSVIEYGFNDELSTH